MNLLQQLPKGKKAAIYFTIDDVHPGTSTDLYEAGGDLSRGALGHVEWLLKRHPNLKITLFVCADWRETYPYPTRRLLKKIPYVKDWFHLTPLRPKGTMALDVHKKFVEYLNDLERVTCGLHGLHHVNKGLIVPAEFRNRSPAESRFIFDEMIAIFQRAGLGYIASFCPPGWECSDSILESLLKHNITVLMSGRDVLSPISYDATIKMSGMKGVSLIFPERVLDNNILHLPSNFHATSAIDRALEIIALGGVVGVKAHIVKKAGDLIAFDGLDETYRNYLDLLFLELDRRYGDSLWWTNVDELSKFLWTTVRQ